MENDVGKVTPGVLVEFAAGDALSQQADGRPRTPSTVNKIKASIRVFFQHLAEVNAIPSNPALALKLKHCRTKSPAILTPDEQQRLMETIGEDDTQLGKRDQALIALLLGTGLRLSSVVSLDIEDLLLMEKRIVVRVKGGHVAAVFISSHLAELLIAYLESLKQEGRIGGPLFCSTHRRRISTRQVQFRFHYWVRLAGIEKHLSIHSLRHTFGTRLYRQTKDLRLVQHALGHRFITTTQLYLHVADEDWQAALEAM
jgi:site-specific recombinase XerD